MTKRLMHPLTTALSCASAGLILAATSSVAAPARAAAPTARLSRAEQISTCDAIGCHSGTGDCHYYVGSKEYKCPYDPNQQ